MRSSDWVFEVNFAALRQGVTPDRLRGLVPPGDARTFTNSGPGPARLLALTVAPAGVSPAQLPRTGGPPPTLRVAGLHEGEADQQPDHPGGQQHRLRLAQLEVLLGHHRAVGRQERRQGGEADPVRRQVERVVHVGRLRPARCTAPACPTGVARTGIWSCARPRPRCAGPR